MAPASHLQPVDDGDRSNNQFRSAEMRLRELGASYYSLETGGPYGDNYRFYCKVRLQGNANEVLAFNALEDDPLKAMNNVVRQVELWRDHLRQ